MATQSVDITWSVHLEATPVRVYRFVATDEVRARFWAEAAIETDGEIDLRNRDPGYTWADNYVGN